MLYGEQTVFNVPSVEVLDAKRLYFESDWYFRTRDTESGTTGTTFVRGMVGVGKQIEIGVNSGPYDLIHEQNPFLDFTVKWRPLLKEIKGKKKSGAFGIYIGSNNGIGLANAVKGKGRDLTYGALSLRLPDIETRIGLGPYFSTKQIFGELRAGAMATFEQPLIFIKGLTIAADWYSGDGAAFTPGLIYNLKNFTFYAGYGLSNSGRKDDLVTLEVGYLF